MDRRSFRERLREHKVEPSVSAWEQMEGMLDALPQEKKKEKKRILIWIFLTIGLGLATVAAIMNLNTLNSLDEDRTRELTKSIGQVEIQSEKLAAKDEVKLGNEDSNKTKLRYKKYQLRLILIREYCQDLNLVQELNRLMLLNQQ